MKALNNYECEGQMTFEDVFGPDIWFGKTSAELTAATKVQTSKQSSKKQSKSQTKTPLFLDMTENGHTRGALWEMDGLSLGAHMMPNIGEFHKGENAYVYLLTSMDSPQDAYYLNCSEAPMEFLESRLSWILERNPDPKYNLSPRACQGILNRAERRGKELPKILKDALIRQAIPLKLEGE